VVQTSRLCISNSGDKKIRTSWSFLDCRHSIYSVLLHICGCHSVISKISKYGGITDIFLSFRNLCMSGIINSCKNLYINIL
jgi:hypothetical protein